jgi:glycosyltransferase involved in cell wall biosynthesis
VRIGVNARRLEGQRLGVGRYIEYLLKHWATMLDGDDVVLYVREPLRDDESFTDRYASKVLGPRLTGMTWEAVNLPRAAREVDVLFCPSYSRPPVFGKPTVVAIHSTNEVQAGTHPWSYRFTYSPLYRHSARAADRVIVPSHSTLEDIQALYGIPEDRLVVVPQGVDDDFGRVTDEDELAATRRRWLGSDTPFVLFVGKLSQRRNIPTLMRAFAHARREAGLPHTLLLLGPNHLGHPIAELAAELEIEDSFVQTDGVVERHEELAAVYSAADLYVNASAYEGFSMTLVEALACGTPVVTVDRSALTEIAGDAAVLVSEPTVEELSGAIVRVLADGELRADLSRRGIARSARYRWENTAGDTLSVLREAAASGSAS